MPLALTEPIEVHLVGGGSDLSGQLLIAALALFGVLLTIWTANKRHQAQLAHDRELRADDLAHDRRMRDREHVRTTLDRTLDQLTDSIDALSRATTRALQTEKVREDEDGIEASGNAEQQLEAVKKTMKAEADLGEALGTAHRATTAQMQATLRLRVWLGPNDPLTNAHADLADQLRAWYSTVGEALEGNRTERQLDHEELVRDEVPNRVSVFENACQDYFAS
jgi:hypothetical protein